MRPAEVFLFLSTIILAIAAQASASDYPACNQERADQGIQSDLNICAHHEFLDADEALNAQWKVTAAKMRALDEDGFAPEDGRPGHFEALLAAQRAWLAYRDAHCVTEGYWARGGSMEPMLVSFCLAGLTKDRTEQLRQLAESPN